MSTNGTGQAPHGPGVVDFLALFDDPTRCAELPLHAIPGVLMQIASGMTRLTALENALAARMLAARKPGSPAEHGAEPRSEQGALTQDAAAEAYNIPLRSLRRLTRTGRVPSYQLGRNRMIRPADLDRYLARCREQGVRVGTRLT